MDKRVFLAFEVFATWPDHLPEGRCLEASHRHLTIAFLGSYSDERIDDFIKLFPKPSFFVSPAGIFSECIFLPDEKESVVAWNVDFLDPAKKIESYYNLLRDFLDLKEKDLLPHVTIARRPFHKQDWQDSFTKIPCILGNLNLYQSLGNLKYKSIWHHALLMPIEELEHTADRAFIVRGDTFQELYRNAQIALSMVDHRFLSYITVEEIEPTAEKLVHHLNKKITKMDGEIGSFCKAVSFHGEIHHTNTYSWEMIVDV